MNATVDHWVITQKEKLKYQDQFKLLQPQNGHVTGGQAKGFFLQSQLPPVVLGQIWALADTDCDGKMDINEFSIACKLINLKLRSFDLPAKLPPTLISSLTGGTPTLTPVAGMSPSDPNKSVSGIPVVPQVPVTSMPIMAQQPIMQPAGVQQVIGMQQQMTNVQPHIMQTIPGQVPIVSGAVPGAVLPQANIPVMGIQPLIQPIQGLPKPVPAPIAVSQPLVDLNKITSPPTSESFTVLPAAPTPPQSNPPSRHMSISERAPSIESPPSDWAIKGPTKLKYTQLFNTTDRTRSGYLTGAQARNLMVQTKLPQVTLAQIWALADMDSDGRLGCEEFVLAMFLCDKALSGEKIPVTLPQDWIPPSFRKVGSRHGSISGTGSRHGSVSGSRHASISSQGALSDADPAAGLPQTTFEDKRKENFDKGQAELDRRRKLLMDQQRKEQEERERKEREEADKRERARLEAERKQQEELERELQRQREVEQEKEEQRLRSLEAKENARKELEKQRQNEWENQKILEMQLQKQREQDNVLKFKAKNQTLTIELGTLNDKIKELSQKICDTRSNVTNVKTVIDGMRSTRDTQMSEMAQLKAKIKEQNQKLLQLTQEKAKWDAKAKSAHGGDATQQEAMNAAFANKQLIINQIKGKIENIHGEIESKKNDINSDDDQMNEVKAELLDLIGKCETLYSDYDSHRNQVLEIKNNKRNESYNAAWDTSSSAWGTESVAQDVQATVQPTSDAYIQYRGVYEFISRSEDEVSFQPGDIIYVLPNEPAGEPGWLKGIVGEKTGWFPETYAELISEGDVDVEEQTQNAVEYTAQDTYNDNNQEYSYTNNTAVEEPTSEVNGGVEYYIAAYPYESNEVGDLNFNAGEIVMVTKKEGDWWTGVIGTRTGLFPSNYVQKADIGGAAEVQKDTVNGNINQENLNEAAVQNDALTNQQQQNDESKTLEDLDTEVSQINTQQQNKIDQAQQGSQSRPMSRTSSMTPGMRAKKGEIAQVIAPFEATSSEQLSLTRGQLIMIRKKTDSGWWEGELQAKGRKRQIGWFPASYVKVLQGGRNSGRNTPVSGSKIEMTETILDKVIALFPYKAQNDDELSFDKDDIISVLGRDEPEWWRGELNGLTGLFPSNYVGPFVTSGKKRKS